ncbi:MAG: acyl carrier protein [Tractidigestivibacter sp.]|jgi:acyl carrier protein|uniref:acyl carrier protein n=1 Tax=Tractidigestivibacter sp. TaxID=2847320 RepID=UPI003D8FDFCC
MSVKDDAVKVLVDKAAELHGKDPATLGPDTEFVKDLGAKSVDYVLLSTALEDEFEVEVPYVAIRACKTFADAGQYVEDQL